MIKAIKSFNMLGNAYPLTRAGIFAIAMIAGIAFLASIH
jgi:hypothetical protein